MQLHVGFQNWNSASVRAILIIRDTLLSVRTSGQCYLMKNRWENVIKSVTWHICNKFFLIFKIFWRNFGQFWDIVFFPFQNVMWHRVGGSGVWTNVTERHMRLVEVCGFAKKRHVLFESPQFVTNEHVNQQNWQYH